MRRLATLLVLLGFLASCDDTPPDSSAAANAMTVSLAGSPAAAIWKGQCAACHGAAGQGNQALAAPALTQLSAQYLTRQLTHFVAGIRGSQPDDNAGKRMA